jgi:hypothetical protein
MFSPEVLGPGEAMAGIILASSNLGFHIIGFNAALNDRGQYGVALD